MLQPRPTQNHAVPLAAWAGQWRRWDMAVCPKVILQTSKRTELQLAQGTATESQYYLVQADNGNDVIVARLGTNGPVVASVPVHGFELRSGAETYLTRVQAYEDGSSLIETVLIMSPVRSEVRVEEEILAGGVMFEDGTTRLRLTAADFDPLGRCKVRCIKPATTKTSVCHLSWAFQGDVVLGEFD